MIHLRTHSSLRTIALVPGACLLAIWDMVVAWALYVFFAPANKSHCLLNVTSAFVFRSELPVNRY
jgi:hypothetical protein